MEADGSGALKSDLTDVPKVDSARCSGCGRCVAACPEKIITLETDRFHKNAVILRPDRCTSCGRCVEACPIDVLYW
ncbi:MAG: 4Fe-4S binding protein [Desulfuromonadaceae bacterium]|nr:4Fe-4S binding protein [Desulfuromonadaceae bacterium]